MAAVWVPSTDMSSSSTERGVQILISGQWGWEHLDWDFLFSWETDKWKHWRMGLWGPTWAWVLALPGACTLTFITSHQALSPGFPHQEINETDGTQISSECRVPTDRWSSVLWRILFLCYPLEWVSFVLWKGPDSLSWLKPGYHQIL